MILVHTAPAPTNTATHTYTITVGAGSNRGEVIAKPWCMDTVVYHDTLGDTAGNNHGEGKQFR